MMHSRNDQFRYPSTNLNQNSSNLRYWDNPSTPLSPSSRQNKYTVETFRQSFNPSHYSLQARFIVSTFQNFVRQRRRWYNSLVVFVLVLSLVVLFYGLIQTGTYGVYGSKPYDYWRNNNNSSTTRNSYIPIPYPINTNKQEFDNVSNVSLDSLDKLANVEDPFVPGDIPFFVHISRCGGSSLKDILNVCFGLVGATDIAPGIIEDHQFFRKDLQVLERMDGSKILNVDMGTLQGIHHAKVKELVNNTLTDYITSQHFNAAAELFTTNNRGRMFTLLRHPIERVISSFYYLAVADWETNHDPNLSRMSIERWARSKYMESNNWMTRVLSNELQVDLTEHHLEIAKEVLRTKCIVGFMEAMGDAFDRFQLYFGWNYPNAQSRACTEQRLYWRWTKKNSHPMFEIKTPTYELLLERNHYDMELYTYARWLFDAQAKLFTIGEGE